MDWLIKSNNLSILKYFEIIEVINDISHIVEYIKTIIKFKFLSHAG